MTPQQISSVQASFKLVAPISEQAAELFYAKLFEIAPEVKPLFKSDMKEQGRKLMNMLAAVVDGLSNLEALLPVAHDLALRHVRYGVQSQHYQLVGTALLDTLGKGLGPAFTPEVKEAWTVAYTTLSGSMVKAAYSA